MRENVAINVPKLRHLSPIIAALAYLLCSAAPSAAETVVRLHADRIAFYYDRYLIEADGNVRVTTNDGTEITGDTFSMDLKLNRFLIASNVHLRSKGGNIDGAAIADFLDFKRVYFIPVIAKPDRWTYENGEYAKPLKGREMPGDVFYFPDTSNSPVYLTAREATIGDKTFVRFSNVVSHALGVSIPIPTQYFYFGVNQDLAQNSLSGANLDLTYNFAGSNNSESAFHVRKDQTNGVYGSFEQHIAGPGGYAVFSVNPGTKYVKFWNLLLDKRVGKRLQFNAFTQLYTQQRFLEMPLASATWTTFSATQAFNQSYLQLSGGFVNYNLLGKGGARTNHPFQAQLSAQTFTHRIAHTPFYESAGYGIGVNQDSYGLQSFGGYNYTAIWNHTLNGTLYLSNLRLGNRENIYKAYSLNGVYSKSYQWFSVPHYTVSDNTTLSLSRMFARQFNAYAQYNINNTGDYYRQGGYSQPATPPIINGVPVTSILAFRGVATLRTATLGTVYSASPNLVTSLTYNHHQDFPIPYPGLFTEPPLNNLGEQQYQNYLGQPPNNITGEVRALVLPHIILDVARTYYFNFGTDRWSPQFSVQVVGQ